MYDNTRCKTKTGKFNNLRMKISEGKLLDYKEIKYIKPFTLTK